jgi:flavin reductase (DIM6/NTAB) family NADH-FMN oxidoreductase RutF
VPVVTLVRAPSPQPGIEALTLIKAKEDIGGNKVDGGRSAKRGIKMKELPLAEVYRLIEPGPVVLLTTRSKRGRANVMAMSWHMMVQIAPPTIACIVSSGDFSLFALRQTRECVIAVPPVGLADKVVKVGNCSGRDTDKFATAWLTPLPAERVSAPLVAECFANLECRVVDTRMANRYNLFVLEVLKAWIDPAQPKPKTIHHVGNGAFTVDGEVIHFESRIP